VATAAQVSRAALYRYFPSKAALLTAAGATAAALPVPVTPRVRILEAALAIISERGMHAATLEEIANRAEYVDIFLHGILSEESCSDAPVPRTRPSLRP
jgi:AcrR family transcriptional regulator